MAALKKLSKIMFSRYAQCKCNIQSNFSFSSNSSVTDSFKYSEMHIKYASEAQKKRKEDPSLLKFGDTYSDHMFEVEWNCNTGWSVPRIVPIHLFQFHPGSKVFHYAQAVFEGMKAFKCSDGSISLFRPELHIKRLLSSAERALLPSFDGDEFLKCLMKLVSIDREWVPSHFFSSSLYIRPTIIGTQNSIDVQPSNSALFYILTCPVGPYFQSESGDMEPVSLLADPTFVRAWPGGVGDKKMACNYAPSLYVQKRAQEQGLHQVLWLFGDNHKVVEAGAMNVFFFFQNGSDKFELATPELDGTILPGVTRRTILQIAEELDEFQVSERTITMSEILAANQKNALLEIFVCGTAISLCPVNKIKYLHKDINIPTMNRENPLYQRLSNALTDIQYGKVESEWSVKVD